MGLPVNTQQGPVIWVNRYQSKDRFEVGLSHEGTLTKGLNDTNGIVHLNVRQ